MGITLLLNNILTMSSIFAQKSSNPSFNNPLFGNFSRTDDD